MRRVIEIVNNECPQLIDDRKMTSCGPFNRSRATIGARNARPTVGQRDLFDRVSIRNFHRETAIVPKCTRNKYFLLDSPLSFSPLTL